jgi:hypothetical protein
VQILKQIALNYPTARVACITYTNAAAIEIRNRAKNSNVVTLADGTPAANYKVEPYPGPGVYPFDTKANALLAVQNEIRLEFACGPWRFFDLRRWGILASTLNAYIAQDITFRTFMQGSTFNATQDDYWPLPQDQIDLQKGVLAQDPAY